MRSHAGKNRDKMPRKREWGGFFREVGGGVCVSCQPIYRSLPCSILFLNFLYKRLREGKDEWASGRRREGREGGESAIMDFISNSLPISRTPKRDTVSKKRTFLNSDRRRGRRIIYRIWTHTRAHTRSQRCTPHYILLFMLLSNRRWC